MTEGNESTEFSFVLDFSQSKNIFVFYFSGLFLQAYILALLVSYLHTRVNAVVYPLTAPDWGTTFTEYIIYIKTSLRLGSSLDPRARITLQLKGSFANSPQLLLQRGKNIDYFLCRGGVNVFVYHSPTDLGDMVELEVDLYNDTPYEIPNVQWKPSYISVLQPVSKKFWGCNANILLKTEDKLTEIFPCVEKKRDSHSIVKCLLLFHVWLSIFNSPVRLGMYNTLVHAIFVFFFKSVLVLSLLYVYEMASEDAAHTTAMVVVLCVWLVELVLEAFIRNTVSGFRAAKDSLFNGLMEPSESLYNSDNFALDYDWDNVRPLVMRNKVMLVIGTRHPSVYGLFPVPRPYSVHNMWGLLSNDKEKESRLMLRILNECSLPLPATMNWLGIEASGRKEEVLIHHASMKFKAPVCFFETWLLDWPLAYAEEPHVAGLIISHVMCSDLLMLMGIKHPKKRAHMAQLCVFQWHGLLCCIMVFLIQYHMEGTKEACTQIKGFISKTLTSFAKRNPREIKASWIKRRNAKQQYNQRSSVLEILSRPTIQSINRESSYHAADMNASSKANTAASITSPRAKEGVFMDTMFFENDNKTGELTKEGLTQTVATFRKKSGTQSSKGKNNNFNTNAGSEENETAKIEDLLGGEEEQPEPIEGQPVKDGNEDDDHNEEEVKSESMLMAFYETFFLGPPYMTAFAPVLDSGENYLRFNNEILAYCCKKKRCILFRQIHRKVGNKVMEVLNNALQDLVTFTQVSNQNFDNSQVWKRRKMVSKMIDEMKKKGSVFEDKAFNINSQPLHEGFNCNRLLTSIHTNLQEFLDKTTPPSPPPVPADTSTRTVRCGFCAKELEKPGQKINNGCQDIERLVKFLAKGSTYVAEKELNSQLLSRYTIQNFCASVLYQARTEALIELEDPPIVMAGHVLQAMIHSMLTNMLPKQTDFHDLSADELRKIGTRLQRIKARYMTSFEEQNRSREEKSRVEKIKHFLHELGIRWQLLSQTRSLMFTAQLLAECLVQERIIGLSVYSGFVSQEHVILLNGDRERLMEVELKATAAVIKIARTICEPIVKEAVEINDEIDVIFTDKTRELNYNVEKLTIAEYLTQPVFLATCTYYIADIISLKIKEFKAIIKYMNEWNPTKGEAEPIPHMELNFKFNSTIRLVTGYIHCDVSSPMLRWGDVVIKGEPPLTSDYIPARFQRDPAGDHVNDMFEGRKPQTNEEKVLAALIGAKRGVDNYNKTEEYDKEKRLQHHLARVQAHLMDQLAEASQAISHTTALDNDFVNEFHQDQLYNVELYACHKLNLPIATIFGVLVLIAMVLLTLFAMFVTCIKGAAMEVPQVQESSLLIFLGLLLYAFIFQPLKCIIYSLANLYVD